MTICRCGTEIKWVDTPAGRVPIEPRITLTTGADRYVVVAYGPQWQAEELDALSPSSGHPDHRIRCPR